MRVAIVGGGAAGFFCAIELKRRVPDCEVVIYEQNRKPLSKVAITGGGRCNLTNTFANITNLSQAYPRGANLIKRAFNTFSHHDTLRWFEDEGIPLVIQEDNCVFPASQSAMQIVNKFLELSRHLQIEIKCNCKVESISNLVASNADSKIINCAAKSEKSHTNSSPNSFRLSEGTISHCNTERSIYKICYIGNQQGREKPQTESCDYADIVVITTGGAPRDKDISFLKELDLQLIPPTPSLFSFNISQEQCSAIKLQDCSGVVVADATLWLEGTNFKSSGELLITHWGVSGPATLKLSSYASRYLSEQNYKCNLHVKWISDEDIDSFITSNLSNQKRKLINTHPYPIASKLWTHLIHLSGLRADITWGELGKKALNKIRQILSDSIYCIDGKGVYKEEFVTSGGVALSNINLNTLESKKYKSLYFAGEVLDIDAITGGFNLQAAWSCGYVVAKGIDSSLRLTATLRMTSQSCIA